MVGTKNRDINWEGGMGKQRSFRYGGRKKSGHKNLKAIGVKDYVCIYETDHQNFEYIISSILISSIKSTEK